MCLQILLLRKKKNFNISVSELVGEEKPILNIAGRFLLPKIGDKINNPDILININKNASNCAIEKPRLIIYLLLIII